MRLLPSFFVVVALGEDATVDPRISRQLPQTWVFVIDGIVVKMVQKFSMRKAQVIEI